MKSSAGFPRRIHHRLHPNLYLGGLWYITICAYRRREIFSVIEDGAVHNLTIGRIIEEEWARIPLCRPGVILDESVIMPNHFHGILHLPFDRSQVRDEVRFELRPSSLGAVIGGFKSAVTSRARDLYGPRFNVWQEGFYEHGVRDEDDLNRIREYIRNNPANWDEDPENHGNRVT